MTFNEKLVRLRKLKGITQDELASAVGVSRQAVYKWESGQSYPEVPKLIEMKLLFGISIDDLLDESFEVVLPEKKVRRRRTEKTAVTAIKEESKAEEAPVAAEALVDENTSSVSETAASVQEDMPVAASASVDASTEEPDVIDTLTEESEEQTDKEPVYAETASAEEKKEEKKRGFFARLFGR